MAEFVDVVRRRRMTRAFSTQTVPTDLLENLIDLAARAPSAGKTQGWHVLALAGADTARFWDVTLPDERRPTFAWPLLLDAPVVLLPFADPQAYVHRYAELDKVRTGLGESPDAWPTPYWTVDASMALMTLLLAAEDAGLGALLFGIFNNEAELRLRLGVPDDLQSLGAVALGYRADQQPRPGRSADRPRRSAAEIIHHQTW